MWLRLAQQADRLASQSTANETGELEDPPAGVKALLVSTLTGFRMLCLLNSCRCGPPLSPDSPHNHKNITGDFQIVSMIYCCENVCLSNHHITATYKKKKI